MSHGPGIRKDFVVVAALERLVAEEVNRGELDAPFLVALVLEVPEAVSLVPPVGEDVKRDLTAD